jgi:hypothetical protein
VPGLRRVWLLLLLVITVLTGGCVEKEYVYVPHNSVLNVQIIWDEFTELGAASLGLAMVDDVEVTMVGARVVYEKESAVFMQSVTREVAKAEGVITLSVPPTSKAHLYVAAVNDVREEAIWLGVKRDITILEDTILDIPMEDVEWVRAEWEMVGFFDVDTMEEVVPSISHGERQSIITFPKELERVELIGRVRDPFQPGPPPPTWRELLIGLIGEGYIRNNSDGWREMYSHFENPKPGEENVTEHLGFQPALSSEMFNLSAMNGHSILPAGLKPLIVRWE